MPVSPQDFELYSRMTGTPMPSDAMSRMQMAPAVYDFTKNLTKKPNLLEKTGNLVKNIGKGAVLAIGAPMVAESMAEQARMQEQLRAQSKVTGDSEVERKKTPAEIIEDKRMARLERTSELKQQERDDKQSKAMDMLRAKKEDLVDTPTKGSYTRTKMIKTDPPQYEEEVIDPFSQQTTTADNYQQDFVPNQTSSGLIDRKIEQGSQIADETPNVAEVLSESQDSRQSVFADPEDVQNKMQSDMIGDVGKNQLAKFLSQKGLDQALLGAIGERMTPEPRIGDSSPLLDHPDVIGGEDDGNLPSGMNTGATKNLSSFYKEMRKMDAQERLKDVSPSDRQVNPLEQRAIDNQEAIDSGFMSMTDEERANETARLGGDRIREMAKESPDAISQTDLKRTGLLSGQLTRFPAGEETEKATERKRLRRERNANMSTSEKADDFTAKFVEGARSDIVRGQRGNQSLGITRIPATNGDSQVGFVLANRPIDQAPSTATTYGFGVAPGAEDIIKGSLDERTFDSYMDRGMKEARQGKKRKAGEIFEFLAPKARIVQGKATLGDIVM